MFRSVLYSQLENREKEKDVEMRKEKKRKEKKRFYSIKGGSEKSTMDFDIVGITLASLCILNSKKKTNK